MRKILLLSLVALFVMAGVAFATNIPTTTDPKNYPTVWIEQVYNGSGSDIVSGYIVEWDHATSDGAENWYDDMCPWVQLCDGASDIWTAGVVPYGNNITNGSTGAIIIRGPAYVLEHSTPPAINNICGSHTNGTVTTDAASGNTSSLGVVILVDVGNSGVGDNPDAPATSWCIVFVDPTQEAD